jgi:tight adherence protein B
MTGAMTFGVYLLLVLAIGLALEGGWLALRSFGRDATTLDRRFARARPPAPGGSDAASKGVVSQLLDARVPALQRQITTAGGAFTSGQFTIGAAVVAGILLMLMNMASAPILLSSLVALAAGFAGPALVLSVTARRRRKKFLDQMPQTVELIARSLQAGHPVATAMAVAAEQMPAPTGPEFGTVLGEMNYGLGRDAALRNLLVRFPLAELRMFAASLEMTRETGGNVAEVLLNLADAMRAKAQLRRKIDAASAEGRISFWVISGLPIVIVGAILALSPSYYGQARTDPLFWPLMTAPPMLWLIGAATIWRMVNFRI